MPASAEMLNRTYEVADESSCSGHLSFDDRDLGLNNQLAAFSYMLCTVNLTRVCSLWAPPLGYIPCGTHMPGTRVKRVCQIPSERAAVNIRELLKLPPAIDALLARGELRANASDGNVTGLVNKCKPKEMASGSCQTCGPYGKNPFTCAVDKLAKGSRVFMLYAYGLRYHQRNRHNPDKPACPMLRLQLSDQVELYSRQLMGRLKLEPGKFIAAQYRTGWAWRVHTQKMSAEWACYGQRTINRSIARLGDRYPSLYKLSQTFRDTPGNVQVFLLTNARSLHEPTVPVPVQVLSEIRIVSLAHTVLLNPMSSFQDAVSQMRGGTTRLFFVGKHDVVRGDTCGCSATDERELAKMGKYGKLRESLCNNLTAFHDWIKTVKKKEEQVILKRREFYKAKAENTSKTVGKGVGKSR